MGRKPGDGRGQPGHRHNPIIGIIAMSVSKASATTGHDQVALVKSILLEKPQASQQEHISAVQKGLNVSLMTAIRLLAQAKIASHNGDVLTKAEFDVIAVTDMLELLHNRSLPITERRKIWESIARIRGYLKQVLQNDAIVPGNLSDPAVMEAALKLDEAIEETRKKGL